MKLNIKIFVILLFLSFSITSALTYVLYSLKTHEQSIISDINKVEKLNNLNNQLVQLQNITDTNVLSYVINQNPQYLDSISQSQLNKARILDLMSPLIKDIKQRDLVRSYIEYRNSAQYIRAKLFTSVQVKNTSEIQANFTEWEQLNELIDASLTDLNQFNVNSISTSMNQVTQIRAVVSQIIFAIVILILLLSFFIYYYLKKSLINPLQHMVYITNEIAKGKFDEKISYHANDEIGELATSFNIMADKLKESNETLEQRVLKRTIELEGAKAKDEAILESIGEGVVVANIQGKLIYWNSAAEIILATKLDATPKDEWEDKYGVFYEDEKTPMPGEKQALALALKGKVVMSMPEFIRNAGAPQGKHIVVTARPIHLANKTFIGGVAIFRDVTKEKEVDRMKTEFISLASHQLRTPPNAIRWNIELLLDDKTLKLNKEQKAFLHQIEAANLRMIKLVESLLNTSRMEMGTFSANIDKLRVEEISHSEVIELTSSLEKKKLRLTEKYAKDLPLIEADRSLLQIIFQNLLSNAVKYTEKGEINISIEKQKEGIKITISDTGYGIPKNQQQKIFTKLFRADNVQQKDTDGSGLGLYLVKSIVNFSQGKIWFESATDKGSTFYVTLPIQGMKEKKGTTKLMQTEIL